MDEDMSPSSLIHAMHMAWVEGLGRRLGLMLDVRKGTHRCVDGGIFVEMDSYATASF